MDDSRESTTVDERTDAETTTVDADDGRAPTELGLGQNLESALAYWGTLLTGLPVGLLFVLIERDNEFLRYHALQSTGVFLVGLVGGVLVAILTATVAVLTLGIGVIVAVPVVLLAALGYAILLAYAGFRALQGDRYRIPYVADYAEEYV